MVKEFVYVVVEDKEYLELLFELTKNLWKVIITQSRPHKGIITITPFELLWQTKQELNNIYGNINTQTFFLEQLLGEEIVTEKEEQVEEVLGELPHTHKLKLEDVEKELPDLICKDFDYNTFSRIDGSNDRFLRKQENTNQLRESVFKKVEEQNITPTTGPTDLFTQENESQFCKFILKI